MNERSKNPDASAPFPRSAGARYYAAEEFHFFFLLLTSYFFFLRSLVQEFHFLFLLLTFVLLLFIFCSSSFFAHLLRRSIFVLYSVVVAGSMFETAEQTAPIM